MTAEEKCKIAIEKGYTYNPDTGEVMGIKGSIINAISFHGYYFIKINNKQLKLHQLAFYITYNYLPAMIDHIDRNKLNNRIENLRPSVASLNSKNILGKGCYKYGNKYQAKICYDGKRIIIGTYDTEDEARQAYLIAKNKYHYMDNNIDFIPKKFEPKGYNYRKDINKFQARIRINGKQKSIGNYDTEEEARNAYLTYKNTI
jgi:hypothetical protein